MVGIDKNASLVEDAVKYMIFLVDADKLLDTALGMYDFSLVLMIAQHAQKVSFILSRLPSLVNDNAQDPREYLPSLRELRALDKYYQRFKIDDHLRRHESALHNICLAGMLRIVDINDLSS
jgi:elongator complex protein 1